MDHVDDILEFIALEFEDGKSVINRLELSAARLRQSLLELVAGWVIGHASSLHGAMSSVEQTLKRCRCSELGPKRCSRNLLCRIVGL